MQPLTKKLKAREELRTATVRDFTGGWNILDDDLNLSSKFSTKLFNCYRAADGTITIRDGTRLFADCSLATSVPSGTVNLEYFNNALIVVMRNGEVIAVQANGSTTRIWDATLAAAQPGAPAPWGPTSFASFAQFNGELIIANGQDKPLIVRQNFSVEYLHDEATGSNLNTPIAKYVTTCNRYLIFSGDPVNPNRVHISARDTSGTFFGDPTPNDGTFIDIGSVLANASIIRGIAPFRKNLIVAYAEGTVIGVLGTYNEDGDHVPNFDDAVEQYGAVSHRTITSYGDDMLMMDQVGVPSLKRTVFTGTLKPERVSDLVDPEMSQMMNRLSFGSLEDRTFAVYNQREGQFMFFIPDTDVEATTAQTTGYIFNYRPSLNVAGWARFDGWKWTCGCRSLQGNLFFGDANGKLWLYGNEEEQVSVDFRDDPSINGGDGVEIVFDWELPWSDITKRSKSKTSKYISMDTRGTAEFNLSMYADRYLVNVAQADAPLLSMEFTAGDTGGFGSGLQPYGAGRNTADERLYAWPAKFQLMKLRIRGRATEPLKFVSITMHYLLGGIFR